MSLLKISSAVLKCRGNSNVIDPRRLLEMVHYEFSKDQRELQKLFYHQQLTNRTKPIHIHL